VEFDVKKRKAIFDRFQEIVYEQQPYIYLYAILDITAIKKQFRNYMPTALGITYTPKGSLHNIEEIYIHRGPQ